MRTLLQILAELLDRSAVAQANRRRAAATEARAKRRAEAAAREEERESRRQAELEAGLGWYDRLTPREQAEYDAWVDEQQARAAAEHDLPWPPQADVDWYDDPAEVERREERAMEAGWYQNLCDRADGADGSHPWRDEG